MSFYQNLFQSEFEGFLPLSDRQYSLTFKVKGNVNTSTIFQCWAIAPYDLSTNKVLTVNYSFDAGQNWTSFTVADAGSGSVSSTAVTAYEVVAALNANATFASLFTASVTSDNQAHSYVLVKANSTIKSNERLRVYVSNSGAELQLRFNKKAGVAELPSYYERHRITNLRTYPDSVGLLHLLDATTTDQNIIDNAGFSYVISLTNGSATGTIGNTSFFAVGDSVVLFDGTTTSSKTISTISSTSLTFNSTWSGGTTASAKIIVVHADYQLLRGRCWLLPFFKNTVDGSGRITTQIEYPAGAKVGDLAVKRTYSYTSTNTNPDQSCSVSYTLTASDLVTP